MVGGMDCIQTRRDGTENLGIGLEVSKSRLGILPSRKISCLGFFFGAIVRSAV